jgi:hypothetical protein
LEIHGKEEVAQAQQRFATNDSVTDGFFQGLGGSVFREGSSSMPVAPRQLQRNPSGDGEVRWKCEKGEATGGQVTVS